MVYPIDLRSFGILAKHKLHSILIIYNLSIYKVKHYFHILYTPLVYIVYMLFPLERKPVLEMHTGKASKIGAFLKLENLFKLVFKGGLEKEFK